MIGRMKTMGMVKRISMEGKFSIYVRNIDYKEVVTENPFGYNIKLLKTIIKVIRRTKFNIFASLQILCS